MENIICVVAFDIQRLFYDLVKIIKKFLRKRNFFKSIYIVIKLRVYKYSYIERQIEIENIYILKKKIIKVLVKSMQIVVWRGVE